MAKTKIYNLYPNNAQQIMNEITDEEMQKVKGSEGTTFTSGISEVNQQSLSNALDQNLNNLIFNLRGRMDAAISGARNLVNQELNLL
ncbi:hypothetical protein NWP17_01440 [Chrysosporum bergii ANA360D]|jgi:hypothetical protein|uniref:Uncharacterized protein n=1 Tax=Chrysosporum bergii ANA360D TaxID=617107 RepID=A0AA43GPD1_9CYAN|nr:hypothetical protein [Chrysosporum bergii]MDH6059119.1 hypothetical protein [Chrysosporum bergii ANA360D]